MNIWKRGVLFLMAGFLCAGFMRFELGRWQLYSFYTNGSEIHADSPDSYAGKKKNGEKKYVALTFDDGPHDVCTPRLLEGLRERNVKASFFLLGESIQGKETIIKNMQQDGHLIGNHTYRHIQLTTAGAEIACDSVEQTNQMIEEITGRTPQYLRPPYGDWNEKLDCLTDMTTVFWSVDSLDWKYKNTDKIVRRVMKDVEDGDIILLHDIFPTSVDAALELVDRLTEEGYVFVTVDELLID